MAEKTQPMALPGRLATIRAPTAMNAAKASSSPTVSARGWRWKLPLATESTTRAATLAANAASSAQATQVERLLTGRLLGCSRAPASEQVVGQHRPGIVTAGHAVAVSSASALRRWAVAPTLR